MLIYEKPPKTKLLSAAQDFFSKNPGEDALGLLTKEGREFWFRRDLVTGKPVKITRAQAENLGLTA